MRKVMLLAALAAMGVTGVAYAATTVTNQYVLKGKITPVKSGTKKHPKAIASQISYTVSTSPTGYRPNVTQKFKLSVQGEQEHTNAFPTCSSSRLLDKTQGPNTCSKGSKIGTGFFIAEIGQSSNQKQVLLTCRTEVSLYNAGGHDLVFYIYKGSKVSGQPSPCPLPNSYAINIALKRQGKNLVASYTVPQALLHPPTAPGTDASLVSASLNIPVHKKKLKSGRKIGLFESFFCPKNGKRHVALTFTQENGQSRTATRNVACKR